MLLSAPTVDVDRYQRDGYLTTPVVLPASRIEELRAECDRLLALCLARPDHYASRIMWEKNNGGLSADDRPGLDRVIKKLEPVNDLSPTFRDLAADPAITSPVSAIFGEHVELFEDKLNLKLPDGGTYPWHQDWSCCWRAHTDELITCFIYLDDADATNGCLQVVPGSHAGKPIYPFRTSRKFEVEPWCVDQSKVVAPTLNSGQMIIFDPYLLHFSDVNRSRAPRRTIIFTFNPVRLGRINEGRFPVADG